MCGKASEVLVLARVRFNIGGADKVEQESLTLIEFRHSDRSKGNLWGGGDVACQQQNLKMGDADQRLISAFAWGNPGKPATHVLGRTPEQQVKCCIYAVAECFLFPISSCAVWTGLTTFKLIGSQSKRPAWLETCTYALLAQPSPNSYYART